MLREDSEKVYEQPHEYDAPGFISAPSQEDLKPTPEESALIQNLIEWQKDSAKKNKPVGWVE